MQVLRSVPCGGSYTTCQFIKDAVAASLQIGEYENKLNELIQLKPKSSQYKGPSIQDLRKEMKSAEEAAALFAAKQTTLLHIADAKKELEQLKDIVVDNPNILQDLAKIKSELAELDRDLFEKKRSLEAISVQLERLNKDKILYDDLLSKSSRALALATAFSKKGVPLFVLKSKLELVNSRIKTLLESAVDISARL